MRESPIVFQYQTLREHDIKDDLFLLAICEYRELSFYNEFCVEYQDRKSNTVEGS